MTPKRARLPQIQVPFDMHIKLNKRLGGVPAAKRSRLAAYCSPLGSAPVLGRARKRPLEKGTSSAVAPRARPFHWWHPNTRVALEWYVSRGASVSAADSAAAVAALTPPLGRYCAAAFCFTALAGAAAFGRL